MIHCRNGRNRVAGHVILEREVWLVGFDAIEKGVGMDDGGLGDFEPVVIRDTFNGIACIGSMRSSTVLLLLVVVRRGRRGLIGDSRSFPFGLGGAALLLARVGGGWTFVFDRRCLLDGGLHVLFLGRRGRFLSFLEIKLSLLWLVLFGEVAELGGPSLVDGVGKTVKVHVLNGVSSSVLLYHSLVYTLLSGIYVERKGRNEDQGSHRLTDDRLRCSGRGGTSSSSGRGDRLHWKSAIMETVSGDLWHGVGKIEPEVFHKLEVV